MDTGENNPTPTIKSSSDPITNNSKLSTKQTILTILAFTPNHTYTLSTYIHPTTQNVSIILSLGLILFYIVHSLLNIRSLSDQSWRKFFIIISIISLLLFVPFPWREEIQPVFETSTILIEAILTPCYMKKFISPSNRKTITTGVLLTSLFMAVCYLKIDRNLYINPIIEITLHFIRIFTFRNFNASKGNNNSDESFGNLTSASFLQQIKFSCIIALLMTILGKANSDSCLIVMITLHLLALIPKFTFLEAIPIISCLTLTITLPIFSLIGLNNPLVRLPLLIFFIISFIKTAIEASSSSSDKRTSSYLAKLDQKRKLNEQQAQEQTVPTQKTKSSSPSKNNTFQMTPIGYIENSCYPDKFGVPRQPKLVPDSYAVIKLNPPYDQADCVRSLEVWSHVWVTFIFHESPEKWTPLIRPPRLGGNAKVGVFASRSTHRPNRLGLSLVEVVKIETDKGVKLHIKGHDLINETPVLDVKPYIPWGDRGENARAGYALAPPEELPVIFMPEAEEVLKARKDRDILEPLIIQVMQQDPRPAYKSEEAERRFGVYLYDLDVRFRILEEDGRKVVKVVEIVKSQFAKD